MKTKNSCQFKDIKIHEFFAERLSNKYWCIFCKTAHNKAFCISDNIEINFSMVGLTYFMYDDQFIRFYKLTQKLWIGR